MQLRTYLTEWRGRDGRTYGGDIRAADWDAAEQACPDGVTVIGELVETIETRGIIHPGTEVMQ